MGKQNVFVYGTLRRHEENHYLLKDADCIARQCWTAGKLLDANLGYPFLQQSTVSRVYGELYQVNKEQLMALDQLEGYDGEGKNNYYDRKVQKIYSDKGTFQAFVYVLPGEKQGRNMKEIEGGNWCIHRFLKEKQSIDYFAYGSCMDVERFENAGISHYFQNINGRGILEGYQLAFTRQAHDGGRADIVEREGGTVEGIVYEIPKKTLTYLYKREGVNTGCYRPALVDVTLNGYVLRNTLTFVVVDKEEETAPPQHYVNEIIRGGSRILSEAYIEKFKKSLNDQFYSKKERPK